MRSSNTPPREDRLIALFAKRPQVIKPGLDRIRRAAEHLCDQDPNIFGVKRTPLVIIAGTNGKGSTSGYLWQLLAAHGRRVGLYTSPHLVHFAERIQTSHQRLNKQDMLAGLDELQRLLPRALYEEMSFFEVTTLLAMLLFAQQQTELNIFEVGIGGRWDATNVIDPMYGEQVCSMITSIGLDHTEFLGTDAATIAGEKAGIMRAGKPVFWGGLSSSPAEADAVIRQTAERLGAPLWSLDDHQTDLHVWPHRLQHAPQYLKNNFSLAWGAFRLLTEGQAGGKAGGEAANFSVFDTTTVPWPPSLVGRFQRVTFDHKPVLLDVCHNVEGARVFAEGLQQSGLLDAGPLPGLISILADKPVDAVLDILRQVLSPIILFPQMSERSWSRANLAPRHYDLCWQPNFAAAWCYANTHFNVTTQAPLAICGSVSGVGEVLGFFNKDPLTLQ